jgi:hypothetical protein
MSALRQELRVEFEMSSKCIAYQHADCNGKAESGKPCSCGCGHRWIPKAERNGNNADPNRTPE